MSEMLYDKLLKAQMVKPEDIEGRFYWRRMDHVHYTRVPVFAGVVKGVHSSRNPLLNSGYIPSWLYPDDVLAILTYSIYELDYSDSIVTHQAVRLALKWYNHGWDLDMHARLRHFSHTTLVPITTELMIVLYPDGTCMDLYSSNVSYRREHRYPAIMHTLLTMKPPIPQERDLFHDEGDIPDYDRTACYIDGSPGGVVQ